MTTLNHKIMKIYYLWGLFPSCSKILNTKSKMFWNSNSECLFWLLIKHCFKILIFNLHCSKILILNLHCSKILILNLHCSKILVLNLHCSKILILNLHCSKILILNLYCSKFWYSIFWYSIFIALNSDTQSSLL